MAAGSSVSGSSRDPLVLAVALVWFTNLSLSLSPSLSQVTQRREALAKQQDLVENTR